MPPIGWAAGRNWGLGATRRHGKWKDRQLISNQWVDRALTPTPAEPAYGFMNWFLNTDRKLIPSAPPSVFVHIGAGSNMIIVDPDHDIVAVVRWIDGGAAAGSTSVACEQDADTTNRREHVETFPGCRPTGGRDRY